jgi:prepilin-type N-terminal cleavage/methylation domain-containing protein
MRRLHLTHRAPFATLRFATLRRSVPPRHAAALTRRAFTLIELLVVVSIILLVAAMTLSAVNLSITGDRIRGAARQVQSFLEGARGRAVYGGNASSKGSGYQCGVRFLRESDDPADPRFNLCSSIQLVEVDPTNAAINRGKYNLARTDDVDNTTLMAPPDNLADSAEVVRVVGTANNENVPEEAKTHWVDAYNQGLLFDNQVILLNNRSYRITIPKSPPNSTTIDTNKFGQAYEELWLQTPYVGTVPLAFPSEFAFPEGGAPAYKILLAPQPMANQEVRSLGNGVVFDLSYSRGLDYFTTQSLPIDVMFSPRGMVVGPITSSGLVQFVLSDREDSLNYVPLGWTTWQSSTQYEVGRGVVSTTGEATQVFVNLSGVGTSGNAEPTWMRTPGATTSDSGVTWTCVVPRRERNIVSLTPLTGKTSVHPVYLDPAGLTFDPFRYSETGEVARQ